MALEQKKKIAAFDIGSSKIVCIIGFINIDNKIVVKGIGECVSKGIKNGKIIDLKEFQLNLLSAIKMAEKVANFNITDVIVNINTALLSSSTINTKIDLHGREINDKDIQGVQKNIRDALKVQGYDIVHLIPLQYFVNNEQVKNLRDMKADILQINFHLLSTPKINISLIKESLNNMNLKLASYISNGYATALAVLNSFKQEIGCMILDIGYGSTRISIIKNTYLYEDSIEIAGELITKDISTILKTNFEMAEKIKIQNVNFLLSEYQEEELIRVDVDDMYNEEEYNISKNVTIKFINDIVKARLSELMELIRKKMNENNLFDIPKYIILTGGCSNIVGIEKFVTDTLGIEATKGSNNEEDYISNDSNIMRALKDPKYSVAIGSLKYLIKKYMETKTSNNNSFGSFIVDIVKKIFGV